MRTDDRKLKIKVTAPPADGKANRQVVKVLADRLKIAKSRITIAGGHRSRDKQVLIQGMSRTEVESRLNV